MSPPLAMAADTMTRAPKPTMMTDRFEVAQGSHSSIKEKLDLIEDAPPPLAVLTAMLHQGYVKLLQLRSN